MQNHSKITLLDVKPFSILHSYGKVILHQVWSNWNPWHALLPPAMTITVLVWLSSIDFYILENIRDFGHLWIKNTQFTHKNNILWIISRRNWFIVRIVATFSKGLILQINRCWHINHLNTLNICWTGKLHERVEIRF